MAFAMKKTIQHTWFAASLLCLSVSASIPFAAPAQAQTPVPNAQLAGKELNAKVEALLKQMTLEEKIGQTVQYSAGFATGPAGSKMSYDELVEHGAIGSMLNVYGAEKTNHYQHLAMEAMRYCEYLKRYAEAFLESAQSQGRSAGQ